MNWLISFILLVYGSPLRTEIRSFSFKTSPVSANIPQTIVGRYARVVSRWITTRNLPTAAMVPRQPRDTATAVRNPLRDTAAPRSCPALSRGGDTGVSRSRVVPDPFAKTLPARMTSRHEKERAKQIQEKCQNLLTQMLRDEDNKYCVDCDAKGLFSVAIYGCAFPPLPLRETVVRKNLRAPFPPRYARRYRSRETTRCVPCDAPRRGFLTSA